MEVIEGTAHPYEGSAPGGNSKVIHHHYPAPPANGTAKIVWAYAGFATVALVAIVGAYSMQQSDINAKQAAAQIGFVDRLARMETKIENLERAIGALERRQ